jgi:hypothetical protein
MNKIDYVIFHCSDSNFGDRDEINTWHKMRGWSQIGYNGVILNTNPKSGQNVPENDGMFQEGRGLDFSSYVEENEVGAHTLDYNKNSIGFCLIGNVKFTVKQFQTALSLARLFKAINPAVQIKGHYEMPTANGKTCPNFDMSIFRTILDSNDFSESNIKSKLSKFIN